VTERTHRASRQGGDRDEVLASQKPGTEYSVLSTLRRKRKAALGTIPTATAGVTHLTHEIMLEAQAFVVQTRHVLSAPAF
jgi:hypothetical protein